MDDDEEEIPLWECAALIIFLVLCMGLLIAVLFRHLR